MSGDEFQKHRFVHRSKRCPVCRSPHCDTVDQMIADNVPGPEIAQWLKDNDPHVRRTLNRRHISAHNIKHRLPSIQELSFEPKEKPIPTDSINKKQIESFSKIQTLDMVQFLDVIITKVQEQVIGGELTPTLDHALKASEIKAKIKQNSPFEGALVAFFTGFGKENGFYNKADVEG